MARKVGSEAPCLVVRILAVALFVMLSDAVRPATAGGKVVAVADGDTLTVLRGQEQVKVRLSEIDAPEKHQPFGAKSKQSLSDLCFGKAATLDEGGQDRYGRTIARVHCDEIDANAEQVRRGLAWVYRKFAPKYSPLYAVEEEAKAAKRGLWRDAEPVPPWEWRKVK